MSSSLCLSVESIFHEATKISWQAEEEGSWDELLGTVRRSGGKGREGGINGRSGESEGREGREGAGRGWENWKASLLGNDLLILSLRENAVSDLRREKVNTEDSI